MDEWKSIPKMEVLMSAKMNRYENAPCNRYLRAFVDEEATFAQRVINCKALRVAAAEAPSKLSFFCFIPKYTVVPAYYRARFFLGVTTVGKAGD